ncbi:MAG: hypothetical protein A3C93_00290 [Candidatus Lloydbacteria bacterium RIFCSPHIGHO2_02_FULL_54_17]|uniref:Uncharacterized protein n=1 Tax=Candidatus Lloydbacteria bacterium RIFCSPHIGHO2_02_FULL_54_17 TaxID=1798664 RepID=A0A1G2DFX3_9BACT|nr:MAG: hypothetical protein A2762_06360 [Candidatus Lloydbacteria bacterium RIFCSPHIGHO2_01_FULL_54_11]OGZ12554.1 MAG: hypothetical protein A3C93_00290 [Candidatus Lloydbacteria bacterium RIFCSPHIGHO2_02_FULL_54_17]OGZ14631.1 MAG: hypothetical protein A2948_02350 [Candidatus Lloydbacteria bacterium RIFCSPLOWO2_01_FULL_54_18]
MVRFSLLLHYEFSVEMGQEEGASVDQRRLPLYTRCNKFGNKFTYFTKGLKQLWCREFFSATDLSLREPEHMSGIFDSEVAFSVEASAVGAVISRATSAVLGKKVDV